MGSIAINVELLWNLARHQAWADAAHWKALHENGTLLEDLEIRKRLNHMVMALRMLTGLAQGEAVDPSGMNDIEPVDQLEAAMGRQMQGLSRCSYHRSSKNDRSTAGSEWPMGSARWSFASASDHAQSAPPWSERIKDETTRRVSADDGLRRLVCARAAVGARRPTRGIWIRPSPRAGRVEAGKPRPPFRRIWASNLMANLPRYRA
jgi:hypothetical protein